MKDFLAYMRDKNAPRRAPSIIPEVAAVGVMIMLVMICVAITMPITDAVHRLIIGQFLMVASMWFSIWVGMVVEKALGYPWRKAKHLRR